MSGVAAILQGTLFAGMNVALTAYVGEELHLLLGVGKGILPRLLVFVFCFSFVLGTVLVESTTIRFEPIVGPIIGPIGTFLATWLAIQTGAIIAIVTGEYTLLAPLAFAVAYAYGHAKAINHNPAPFGTFLSAIVLLFGLIVLYLDTPYVDDFADQIGDTFELQSSDMPLSYLKGSGGLYGIPGFVPLFVTMTSFGLMRAQTPTSSPFVSS